MEQRLKVADRITKRIGIKPGSSSRAAAAAAAADEDGTSSGDSGSRGARGNGDLERKKADALAELIRRNGEEFAANVEQVVDKVRRLR